MKRDTGVDPIDADVRDALQRDKLDKWRSIEAINTQELLLDRKSLNWTTKANKTRIQSRVALLACKRRVLLLNVD